MAYESQSQGEGFRRKGPAPQNQNREPEIGRKKGVRGDLESLVGPPATDAGMYDYSQTHTPSNVDTDISKQQVYDVDLDLEHWTGQQIDVDQNLDFWLNQSNNYGRPSKFVDEQLGFWEGQKVEVDKKLDHFKDPENVDTGMYDYSKTHVPSNVNPEKVPTEGQPMERSIMNWMNNSRWKGE